MRQNQTLTIEDAEVPDNKETIPYRAYFAASVQQAYIDATNNSTAGRKHQMSALLWMFGDQSAPTSFDNVANELQGINADAIRSKVKGDLGENCFFGLIRQLLGNKKLDTQEREALRKRTGVANVFQAVAAA